MEIETKEQARERIHRYIETYAGKIAFYMENTLGFPHENFYVMFNELKTIGPMLSFIEVAKRKYKIQ